MACSTWASSSPSPAAAGSSRALAHEPRSSWLAGHSRKAPAASATPGRWAGTSRPTAYLVGEVDGHRRPRLRGPRPTPRCSSSSRPACCRAWRWSRADDAASPQVERRHARGAPRRRRCSSGATSLRAAEPWMARAVIDPAYAAPSSRRRADLARRWTTASCRAAASRLRAARPPRPRDRAARRARQAVPWEAYADRAHAADARAAVQACVSDAPDCARSRSCRRCRVTPERGDDAVLGRHAAASCCSRASATTRSAGGQHREHDDEDRDELDVLLHERVLAEEVAEDREAGRPTGCRRWWSRCRRPGSPSGRRRPSR